MDSNFQEQVSFFLTGKRTGSALESIEGLSLRPALLACYRDLASLRYDFPIVLVDDGSVHSLSGLVDEVVAAASNDGDAERLGHHAMRLERAMRERIVPGVTEKLSNLWRLAEAEVVAREEKDAALAESLRRLGVALAIEGDVVACDRDLPERLFSHLWERGQRDKIRHMRRAIDHLLTKLRDILKADDANSPRGLSADRLRASMGRPFDDAIDFTAMSKLLTTARPVVALSSTRRKRIERVIATLESQSFFPTGVGFVFHSCGEALDAYAERLSKMVELAKALSIAGLEIDGRFRDGVHDALFDALGAEDLDPADTAKFPDYLVLADASELDAAETARLMEALSSGLPMKVVVRADDLAGERGASGERMMRLPNAAIAMGGVYVLQSASSNLYRYRDRIGRGVSYDGPALFCVYTGAGDSAGDLPPYLAAAAAMESRAFPAFTFDPLAGTDWASRFSLAENPQADLEWPLHTLSYEDDSLQRASREVAFTYVDFLACDERYASRFARVPKEKWNGNLVPVPDSVAGEPRGFPDRVPCLWMVDRENTLHLVIPDGKLIRGARRCREQWRSLQELGGIRNSHAERLVESERRAWEARTAKEAKDENAVTAAQAPEESAPVAAQDRAVPAGAEAPVPAQGAEKKRSDEAYIESARCTSCNECIKVNDRMFKYNENKQAYIADLKAGTYADLVTAAESCQVAIIHPGKPWNPDEPGLEDLLKRAEAFR